MNIRNNPQLQNKLAAEYVLGTLRGGARRRFETWLQKELYLVQVVREWQAHLMPMAEFASAKVPDKNVWKVIEKSLHLTPIRTGMVRPFLESIKVWRNLSLIAVAASIVLMVVVVEQNNRSPANDGYVASMLDEQTQAIAVISSDNKNRQLVVRFVKRPQVKPDQSLELWSISKEGKVNSLGLLDEVSADGLVRVTLPKHLNPELTAVLAISLEARGGSGNPEKPSGPILFKGSWLKLG